MLKWLALNIPFFNSLVLTLPLVYMINCNMWLLLVPPKRNFPVKSSNSVAAALQMSIAPSNGLQPMITSGAR